MRYFRIIVESNPQAVINGIWAKTQNRKIRIGCWREGDIDRHRERERGRGGKLEFHASPSTGEITDSASKKTPLFLTDTCPVS